MSGRAVDRRAVLGATVAAPLLWSEVARAQTRLVERQPSLSATLPATRYFEVDSRRVGARFAIWVATPPGYDRSDAKLPVVYLTDGNGAAPSTIPRLGALPVDAIAPIRPFIEVCVGYVGVDTERSLAVRARDLIPPGEPPPPGMSRDMTPAERATLRDSMTRGGLLDAAGAELYIHNLLNPAADKFLAFLTEELHPLIADRYRVEATAGLFGYSYGGLFSTYALLSRPALFTRFGAGSSAILPVRSRIFSMYDEALAAKSDFSGRAMHMTVNALEVTAPSLYQPMVGAGTTEFVARAGQHPLPGLAFTSRLIENESHVTGYAASWFSFVREYYRASRGS